MPWGKRWRQFWFEPSAPTDLSVCRILFYAVFFALYLRRDLSEWASVSPVFWMPIPLFQHLHWGVLSAAGLETVDLVWKAALVMSCVGLWTRPSTLVAFVLGGYVLGLPHNFGKTHNFDAIVLLTLGVLALSRCGDAWSVDRFLRRRRGQPAPSASGEYTWPVRLAQALLVLVFFGAGTSKLRHSGLGWVFSDNMAMLMIEQNTPLSCQLAQLPWLYQLVAAGSLLMETGAPLALFSRRARWVLMPGLFLMQAGIWVVMNVKFQAFMVCYLFWVPWGRAAERLRAAGGRVAGERS